MTHIVHYQSAEDLCKSTITVWQWELYLEVYIYIFCDKFAHSSLDTLCRFDCDWMTIMTALVKYCCLNWKSWSFLSSFSWRVALNLRVACVFWLFLSWKLSCLCHLQPGNHVCCAWRGCFFRASDFQALVYFWTSGWILLQRSDVLDTNSGTCQCPCSSVQTSVTDSRTLQAEKNGNFQLRWSENDLTK